MNPATKLAELLRSYPGGMRGLIADSGISGGSLRRFAAGKQRKVPWNIIRQVAGAGGWTQWEVDATYTAFGLIARPSQDCLVDLFQAARGRS